MKKMSIFIGGLITGIILTIGVSLFFASNDSISDNPQFFETPGECVTKNNLEVFQVLNDDYALASEVIGGFSTSLVVLISNPEGNSFYDEQKIIIPKGKCARQIGVYKYRTKSEIDKTVPVVQIME